MLRLHCGHDAAPSSTRLCEHLFGAAPAANLRFLSGVKLEFDLCCHECATRWTGGENVAVFAACQACVDAVYDAVNDDWFGEPEIIEQITTFPDGLEVRLFPVTLADAKSVAPLQDGRILAFIGDCLQLFDEDGATFLMEISFPTESDKTWGKLSATPRLLLSKDARFAALVNDFGQRGVVIDLEKRVVAMQLNRGDYYPETTLFPIAFFESEGRTLLVHSTDWNRLDISNPQIGESLTERASTNYQNGEASPHYLDYFHGRLHVSPDNQWIADDGWHWHPIGVPAWWSLEDWARENVWESEDGPSRREPLYRENWNLPMCWIGCENVAIYGLGCENLIDGARIFGVAGEEITAFAGPKGAFFSDGVRLFSVDDNGLQLWDIQNGARTGRINGFRPQFQIEGALVEIVGREMRCWNYSSQNCALR